MPYCRFAFAFIRVHSAVLLSLSTSPFSASTSFAASRLRVRQSRFQARDSPSLGFGVAGCSPHRLAPSLSVLIRPAAAASVVGHTSVSFFVARIVTRLQCLILFRFHHPGRRSQARSPWAVLCRGLQPERRRDAGAGVQNLRSPASFTSRAATGGTLGTWDFDFTRRIISLDMSDPRAEIPGGLWRHTSPPRNKTA